MTLYRAYFLLIACFVLLSCDTDDNRENCDVSFKAADIKNEILVSYNKSCESCLKNLLDDWGNEFMPDMNIADSIKPIYEVYKEVYSPWALERISNSEWGDGIYKDISYYIIQDSINYDFNFDKDYDENGLMTIKRFRPEIANDAITTLYLNDDYREAINCFLGADGFNQHSEEEKMNRYKYLNSYLFLFHGHWGNYWHLETHPEISRISFNEAVDKAKVYFRLGYEGGEILLDKNGAKWDIVDWEMIWIE